MKNSVNVKLGVVAVSRDCFPVELSSRRRKALCEGLDAYEIKVVIENENDVRKAIDEIKATDVNAIVVYLGNFGPEGPETKLVQTLQMPAMFVAAAEESGDNLIDGRGDAYCGMLNASYNLGLRGLKAYIPENPVGTADELRVEIAVFKRIAAVVLGVRGMKILGFGPRPHDFVACNAPIKPLFDLGVEIQENSELDLYASFREHEGDNRIPEVIADMEKELGKGNAILPKLAQFELTLMDWYEDNLGMASFGVFANKCWPAFQTQFGFVPCYVNSRMTERGIPVACETDIYGALSEFIIQCAIGHTPTLLDINNTVPRDMYDNNKDSFKGYQQDDLFMGFHCGNTSMSCLKGGQLKYQLIMKRLLEPDSEPNISRGTLEGTIKPGDVTLFRLQSTADCKLRCYVAEGEIIDVDPKSFGGIGIFAIKEMARFYRHILIEKRYPHHAGIAFDHAGKVLFEAMKMLGVSDIAFNQPKGMMYKTENPFR